MNKIILSGRLAQTPELKTTPAGISVCSFNLAVSRKFKNQDGGYDADFIPCVAWRSTAEFISKYFQKGSSIIVSGALQSRNYETNEGHRRYVYEAIIEDADFCGGEKNTSNAANYSEPAPIPQTEQTSQNFEDVDAEGDLPF